MLDRQSISLCQSLGIAPSFLQHSLLNGQLSIATTKKIDWMGILDDRKYERRKNMP